MDSGAALGRESRRPGWGCPASIAGGANREAAPSAPPRIGPTEDASWPSDAPPSHLADLLQHLGRTLEGTENVLSLMETGGGEPIRHHH